MAYTRRWKFLDWRDGKIASRNGYPLRIWTPGVWEHVDAPLILCFQGLHCSKRLTDAFRYIPGSVAARVEVRGAPEREHDKAAYRHMRIAEARHWAPRDSAELAVHAVGLILPEGDSLAHQRVDLARAWLATGAHLPPVNPDALHENWRPPRLAVQDAAKRAYEAAQHAASNRSSSLANLAANSAAAAVGHTIKADATVTDDIEQWMVRKFRTLPLILPPDDEISED